MRRFLIVAAAVGALAAPVAAQTAAPPTRLFGTVASFDGDMLHVRARDGRDVAIRVPPTLNVGALAERTLADIKAGDYVGSAAMKGTDGKLHAVEVHIFTEAQRGLGEGHRPMGEPDKTMTNATVAEVAAPAKAGVLRLKYKDGEQTILVGPEARVVAFIAGDRTLLKPGAAVRVFAVAGPDAGLIASGIQAEKDGVPPLE